MIETIATAWAEDRPDERMDFGASVVASAMAERFVRRRCRADARLIGPTRVFVRVGGRTWRMDVAVGRFPDDDIFAKVKSLTEVALP